MKIEINLRILFIFLLSLIIQNISTYIIFMAFIIVHEISHLIVGVILGGKPRVIKIEPFGVSLEFYSYEKSNFIYKTIFFLAGPLSNLLFSYIFRKNEILFYTNLSIFVFNLLPILPLDGGNIVKEMFSAFTNKENAHKFSLYFSKFALMLLSFIYSITIIKIKNIYILFLIIYLWYLYYIEEKKFNLYIRTKKILNKINC